MEWLQFLPKDAAVLELGWDHWVPDQWRFLAKRRGLLGDVFIAGNNVTIEWPMFMKKNNISNLTEADKRIHLKNTEPPYANDNPYKFGLGTFDTNTFCERVTSQIRILEKKFGVKFHL